MKNKPKVSKVLAALGVPIISFVSFAVAPTASAWPGYSHSYDAGCYNGYQPAGRFAEYDGVQDVCALPSVVDFRGFVNPVSASVPAPPPEWQLPGFVQLNADLPPCYQYDPRTFDGPCAPPWLPLGY